MVSGGALALVSSAGSNPVPDPAAAPASRVAQAWAVLGTVLDPEVPALSVCDLGIVREVIDHADGLELVLTPTYSGCPATEVIAADCRAAIAAAGLGAARVTLRRAPAWTTAWISAAGRSKLRAYGIAPPGPVPAGDGVPVRLVRRASGRAIACPRCRSTATEQLSAFGATACKSLYRCLACREPFEYFKPI